MGNKYWPIPMSAAAKRHARMGKVRFHLRTRGEGLTAGFTNPSKIRHRMNHGGSALVCAGMIGGRVRVWHYLGRTWNASETEEICRWVDCIKFESRTLSACFQECHGMQAHSARGLQNSLCWLGALQRYHFCPLVPNGPPILHDMHVS